MAYIVKELRQEELLRLLLAGYKLKEAAAYLKVTPWTVYRYLRETEFMNALKAANEEIWAQVDAEIKGNKIGIVQRAEEAAQDALEEMIKLAKGARQEGVRFKAAQDLMDRDTRISRTKRVEGEGDRRPILNAVFLQQAVAAMREEEVVQGERFIEPTRPTAKNEKGSPKMISELPPLPPEDPLNKQLPLFEKETDG
jgi:hypothetical protein